MFVDCHGKELHFAHGRVIRFTVHGLTQRKFREVSQSCRNYAKLTLVMLVGAGVHDFDFMTSTLHSAKKQQQLEEGRMRNGSPGTAVTSSMALASEAGNGKAESDLPNGAAQPGRAVSNGSVSSSSSPLGVATEVNGRAEAPNGAAQPVDTGPPSGKTRDSSWLELEVCRDFQRQSCPRIHDCRFAHPQPPVVSKEGKVTCCYDFLKVDHPRAQVHPRVCCKNEVEGGSGWVGGWCSGRF